MSNDLLGLAGRVVLVTGAGRGGGEGIARQFARAGACLALVDLDEARVQGVAADLEALGAETLPVVADVTDAGAVDEMLDRTLAHFGRLDVGVSNVGNFGVHRPAPVLEQDTEFWDACVSQNLLSTFLCAKAYARAMLEGGEGGAIVNISSLSGLRASVNLAPYGAVKAGVMHLTQTLALEFAPHGIRVNCVAPTALDSPSLREGLDPDEIAARQQANPLGRLCDVQELGGAVVLLASDLASYVTGQTLMCDGGASVTTRRPVIRVDADRA